MEAQRPTLPVECRVCGQSEYRYAGIQWLRIKTILRMGETPRFVDPERPDRAAVKLYVCANCGDSFIEL